MEVDVPVASSSNSNAAANKVTSKTVDLPDPSVFDLNVYADNYQGEQQLLRRALPAPC